jgi:hypothetical protein
MWDCVALATCWLTLACAVTFGNIQGVLDLLSNGFDITAPVRAHLRPADTTATSNENRSASWAIGLHVLRSVLPTQFGSINERSGEVA